MMDGQCHPSHQEPILFLSVVLSLVSAIHNVELVER